MKKYMSLVLLFGLMLSFSPALAQGASDPERMPPIINPDLKPQLTQERKDFVEKIKSERETFMQELKAKREAFRQASAEQKNQFCEKAKRAWGERFGMSISALEKIQDKVEDLIEKSKVNNKDTTKAEEYLKISREKSDAAKKKLEDTKAGLPTDCSKLTPEDYEKIKLSTREARDLLKESRENLHQAIKELRTMEKPEEDSNEDNN